jgi:ABC-type lipoprotein release transport system permease subunit
MHYEENLHESRNRTLISQGSIKKVMVIFKLALRNIMGASLRTWLNVFILSLAFIAIIWMQGMIDGMNKEAMTAMIDMEYGGGQYWHQSYDPYDPLTLEDAHAPLSPPLAALVAKGQATPILMASGAIYPDGRIQTVRIKGIEPNQQIIKLPSEVLQAKESDVISALIGSRMADQTKLKIGDYVTARWRDVHGAFDATDFQIKQIMNTTAQSVDTGIVWIPLQTLQNLLQAPGQATVVTVSKSVKDLPAGDNASGGEDTWVFRDHNYLLHDIITMVRNNTVGSSIMYVMLLFMALLAIFDTQVLAIFRRRKEIGMLMALGMPRSRVIRLFTLEGALHGLFALGVGAIYGIPLLWLSAVVGYTFPRETIDQMQIALPPTLYPSYGVPLVVGTTLLVLVTVTIVSFMPTRRISKLKPTDALRGKLT